MALVVELGFAGVRQGLGQPISAERTAHYLLQGTFPGQRCLVEMHRSDQVGNKFTDQLPADQRSHSCLCWLFGESSNPASDGQS